ncbi:MAG TPA: hypothetical protein VMU99_00285 [Acidimicrobiales bacterium]|nr:hypothetical protein [Acidimicrobiales bacterium]
MDESGVIAQYLELGLRVGRHIEGFVDSYYGPLEIANRIAVESVRAPELLRHDARALVGAIDSGDALGSVAYGQEVSPETPGRRRYLRSQLVGVEMTTRVLSNEAVDYADEVEACYGVRPKRVPEEMILETHRNLDLVMPGSGPLRDRLIAWREAQAIEPAKLGRAVASLCEDLRARTDLMFGLPGGESIEFEYVNNKPWSGFNYYLGGLRSRVAINIDLPVLSTMLARLVAHEAYPGHHTEHSRKEAGLVRTRHQYEESISLVGTPQCLIAEGLADLGLEVVMGIRPEAVIAEHFQPLGISYDEEVIAVVAAASDVLSSVRANAAFRLHEDHADPETVIDEIAYFGLQPRARAAKSIEFLLDPTWRAYTSCYVEGLPLCRNYVAGDARRFERLITEQVIPADLISALPMGNKA